MIDFDFNNLAPNATGDVAPTTPLEVMLDSALEADGQKAVEKFEFRSLLTDEQRSNLTKNCPALANSMVANLNNVLLFGRPTMEKLNNTSDQLLEAQRHIKIPQADSIMNDLLRDLDGYEKQYRMSGPSDLVGKISAMFKKNKYAFTAMVQEAKPLVDKLNMAEAKILQMEMSIAENVTRGQTMHRASLEHLDGVVGVLATLEQVIDIVKADMEHAQVALEDAVSDGAHSVSWRGKTIATKKLQEIHANYVWAFSEVEKTFFDWRQQFFLGFANAPATRNMAIGQFAMRRRLAAFRTMGIPQAKQAIALWQQAVLAKEGAEMGAALQAGVNQIIQKSYGAVADATELVAQAAAAPIITEDTIWSVVDSIRDQCRAIVAADKEARALRDRNLAALEKGEVIIKDEFANAQAQLASNASPKLADSITTDETDVAAILGMAA